MTTQRLKDFVGEHQLQSEQATIEFASLLACAITPPALILLEGELGSGKTRFTKGFGAGLGINPAAITSPTFILMNEHKSANGTQLVHVDAYRLDPNDESDPTIDAVTDRLFESTNALCVIEWPSMIQDHLSAIGFQGTTLRIHLWHAGESERTIRVELAQ